MAWLEVETKIRVADVVQSIKDMRERIKKIAKLKKKTKKGDDYFAIKRRGYPKKAFRIRTEKGKCIVNFKKWLKKYWSKDVVVKEEFEFELPKKSLDNFLALLKDLGFEEWVKKRKVNETYIYNKDKNVSIELNRVEHLGWFVEIEYLAQPKDMNKAKKRIRQVLRELGVNQEDIDNTGYTKMLWDKGIRDRKFFLIKKVKKKL